MKTNKTMKMTVKEFAETNSVTKTLANAVLTVLTALGLVRVGTPIKAKQGRPTNVYEIPDTIEMVFQGGTYTAESFAKKYNVNKITASSFLKFLLGFELVTLEESVKGRGRPKLFYNVPELIKIEYDFEEVAEVTA